jgi:hypothetical protein
VCRRLRQGVAVIAEGCVPFCFTSLASPERAPIPSYHDCPFTFASFSVFPGALMVFSRFASGMSKRETPNPKAWLNDETERCFDMCALGRQGGGDAFTDFTNVLRRSNPLLPPVITGPLHTFQRVCSHIGTPFPKRKCSSMSSNLSCWQRSVVTWST